MDSSCFDPAMKEIWTVSAGDRDLRIYPRLCHDANMRQEVLRLCRAVALDVRYPHEAINTPAGRQRCPARSSTHPLASVRPLSDTAKEITSTGDSSGVRKARDADDHSDTAAGTLQAYAFPAASATSSRPCAENEMKLTGTGFDGERTAMRASDEASRMIIWWHSVTPAKHRRHTERPFGPSVTTVWPSGDTHSARWSPGSATTDTRTMLNARSESIKATWPSRAVEYKRRPSGEKASALTAVE